MPEVSDLKPFKAIVVIEDRPARQWQNQASRWLVDSGCLYMMAWGEDCNSWDDSVDWAHLEKFDYGDSPDNEFVMTTWHEDGTLLEVFEFAKVDACHPTVALDNTLVLHIGSDDKQAKFKELFDQAQCAPKT